MTWRICERWGILPPGVKRRWEDIDCETESMLIMYEQIRQYEEQQELAAMAGAGNII